MMKFCLFVKQIIGGRRFLNEEDMYKKIKDCDECTLIGTFNLNENINEIKY